MPNIFWRQRLQNLFIAFPERNKYVNNNQQFWPQQLEELSCYLLKKKKLCESKEVYQMCNSLGF